MRLTLRTLLAYLDDILPPAETKELGEKIAATPAASQLVDRIREVMRKRRLTAPEPDGSGGGIEPNLVAEYLDNNLASDRVADVERICLESDVNLAEAAACHQILTLVLGEPVEISGRLRERMYALGPQGTPVAVPESPAPSKNVRDANAREQLAAIKSAQVPKTKTIVKKPESRVPEYLRHKPLWKRLLPWVAIAAVIAIWFGLLYGDPSLFRGTDDAEPIDGVVAVVDAAGANDADREPIEAPVDPGDIGTAPQAAASDLPELPVDPAPPADDMPVMQDDKDPEPAGEVVASEAATDATKITPEPAGRNPGPMPEPASDTPPAAVAAAGPPRIDIVAATGSVLRYEPTSSLWFPIPEGEDPPVGVPLAVLEPFEAKMTADGVGLGLSVLGGTRFTPMGATDAGKLGFDLAQGRIRFAADPTQPVKVDDLMFALRLGQGLWRVEALTPETVFGIEALPLQPTGEGQDLSDRTPQGVVYVAQGTVRVADAGGHVEVTSAGNRLILTPVGNGIGAPPAPAEPAVEDEVAIATPSAAADAAIAAADAAAAEAGDAGNSDTAADAAETPVDAIPRADEPLPADATSVGLPSWMTPREPTSASRRAMVAFQKEILAGVPISESLLPAVDSPLYFVAEPSAKALALIEDVDGMVKTLRSGGHEAMFAAIEGLRNWLGRSPGNAEILKRQLDLIFAREGLSETLYLLLLGFNSEDANDEIVAMQLVEWLDHPEAVVRELAFYHVKRLSGGLKMNYVPTHSSGQRAGAVKRWRDFVSRNGGLTVTP